MASGRGQRLKPVFSSSSSTSPSPRQRRRGLGLLCSVFCCLIVATHVVRGIVNGRDALSLLDWATEELHEGVSLNMTTQSSSWNELAAEEGGEGGVGLPPPVDNFGFLKTSSGALGQLFSGLAAGGRGGESEVVVAREEKGRGREQQRSSASGVQGAGDVGGNTSDVGGGNNSDVGGGDNSVVVHSLDMNPVSRTDTGLFPSLELWPADRVFVVSGEEVPSRGSLMLDDLLQSAGMNYTRVVGPQRLIDERYPEGSVIIKPPDFLAQAEEHQRYRSRMRTLTHVELWAMAFRKDAPFVMVFDDETVFNPFAPFKAKLEKALRQLIFLDLKEQVALRPSFDVCLLARWPLADFGEPDLAEDVVEAKSSMGAGAYILSREGARELLRKVVVDGPLDEVMWRVPGLRWRAVTLDYGWNANSHEMIVVQWMALNPNRTAESALRTLKGQIGQVVMLGERDDPPLGNTGGLACRPTGTSGTSSTTHRRTRKKKRGRGGGGNRFGRSIDMGSRKKRGEEEEEKEQSECDWSKAERRRTALLLRRSAMEGDRSDGGVSGFLLLPPSHPLWIPLPESPSDWPLFVINLPNAGHRMKAMIGLLQGLGFRDVVRAVGFSPGDAEMDVFKSKVAADKQARTRIKWNSGKRFLSRGEVGCALSHYLVWLEIVANQIPYAMIVEDDIVFPPPFPDIFRMAMSELNGLINEQSISAKFDVCLLGRKTVVPQNRESPPRVSPNLVYSTPSWQTHAYLISLEGAQKLVSSFFVNDPLDTFWWRTPDTRFLAIEPALIGQSSTEGLSVSTTQLGADTPW